MQVGSKLKKLRTNKGGQYYDPSYFQSMGIIQNYRRLCTTTKWCDGEEEPNSSRNG